MRFITVALFLFVLVIGAGCTDINQRPLERLFASIERNVTSKQRPEIQKLSGQERGITFFRDSSRDAYHTVEGFLAGNPTLTTRVLEQVKDYRDAEYAAWQHHDVVVRNGIFNLSADELAEGVELSEAAALKMMAIGSQ